MKSLPSEERTILNRIGDEPRYWIRQYFSELQSAHHDAFFDLLDRLKALWEESRSTRIDLCFVLRLSPVESTTPPHIITDLIGLQREQQAANGQAVFEIDLQGKIVGSIDIGSEIEPVAVRQLSQIQNVAVFWLGPEFQIFCKGFPWTPKHKREVLREIKSKKRRSMLSMTSHMTVLNTHFEQYVRDEARMKYWFKRNKLLQPSPEALFQQSLWSFIDSEVETLEVSREPMFKDASRCDIKVIAENLDLYFIEVKWIGKSAVRKQDSDTVVGDPPHEFPVARAIDGAYQTKLYIEKNNSTEYDNRIRLGIYLVYDAYHPPRTPIAYGSDIDGFVLLKPVEFSLISIPPSRATKGIARRKGLVKKSTRRKK
jgi:hypothetical protein